MTCDPPVSTTLSEFVPLLRSTSAIAEYTTIAKTRHSLSATKTCPLPPVTTQIGVIIHFEDDSESRTDLDITVRRYSLLAETAAISAHCEYCRQNDLIHDLEAGYHRGKVRRSPTARLYAILECLIKLQMCMLAFVVPLLLVIILYALLVTEMKLKPFEA
jgi:hypothetical protein